MIIRIVRMHFTKEGVAEFLSLFDKHKEAIRNFNGCIHLELLKDHDNPTCFATLSHWNSQSDLDAYRKSQLFEQVWGQAKSLFEERSQAFSLEKFIEV